jgi:hypothetical protein
MGPILSCGTTRERLGPLAHPSSGDRSSALLLEGCGLGDGSHLVHERGPRVGAVHRIEDHGDAVNIQDPELIDLARALVVARRPGVSRDAVAGEVVLVARAGLTEVDVSGTWRVTDFPAYPPIVTSTGSETSRDLCDDSAGDERVQRRCRCVRHARRPVT